MGWTLRGAHASLEIKDGTPHIFGTAAQELHSGIRLTAAALSALANVECGWSIYPNDAPGLHIDGLGMGLFARVKQSYDAAHYMITYYSKTDADAALLGVTICLPPSQFERQFVLWKDFVFRSVGLRYVIALDYLGFRTREGVSDNPTFDEWTAEHWHSQRPVFGSGVQVSFLRDRETPNV